MTPDAYVQAAVGLQRSRRLRDDVFGSHASGFGEPAWDMLLDLFIADAQGARSTAAELASREHVEATTGHTFLRWLASRGLVMIAGDDVALEERGRELMLAYLERDAP